MVQFAQPVACRKEAYEAAVDVGFVQQPLADGFRDGLIAFAAVEVGAVLDGDRRGMLTVGGELMVPFLVEVGYRPAVRHHYTLISPFSAQYGVHQIVACPAGEAPETVVCYHDFLHVGLRHEVLECGKIGFAEVALANFCIEAVAERFGTRMHSEVLGAGVGLEHRGVGRALEPAYHRHSQLPGEVRILAIGLHAASPAGIAEDVDIGSPERNSLIMIHMPCSYRLPVLHPGLIADRGEHLVYQRLVERRCHRYRHRENGGLAAAGNAVQRLVPPIVSGYPGLFHGRGMMHHHPGFLLKGKSRDDFPGPLLGFGLHRCHFLFVHC